MNTRIQKHIGYYASLAAILFLGVFAIINISYDKTLQTLIVITVAVFYIMLGVIHHLLHHNLTLKIMVEYILMGAVGAVLILFVLGGR